ncbi:adenylosuccinate synthetase [Chitinophaga sedimenti]|uniref:adenylosuccinate synthetase n=1 Tax=Chitinophaga sedimenti TaxID=2033606 RepID=UPI00249EAB3E|nr:adenylosuccinate synthetase [Chitinophaga sedimenti]
MVDAELVVNDYLQKGKKVLAEGAQGSLLDVDFGSYPFVTSSNTTSAGACSGLGIAPQQIGEVIGIMKAYCTRVGGGPFPTEQENEMGELLRRKGQEFGAVSGRPRRTGWLDLPALKYAMMLNGVTQLVITKADVLAGIDKLLVCTHYEEGDYLPYDHTGTPVYKEFEGWQDEQEENLWAYVRFIEAALGVPVKYLSVGPDRKQTIFLN